MDQQKKILLVEDEQLIRDLYTRELAKAGYAVKAASSAEEGLIELTKEMFDMLLLDIMLPGMNGLEMLKEYKSKNPQTAMIVVLLTNLGQDSIIKEGFELGAQGYLIKGAYTPTQIIQEVRSAFGNKGTSVAPGAPVNDPTGNPGGIPPAGTPPTTDGSSTPPPAGNPPAPTQSGSPETPQPTTPVQPNPTGSDPTGMPPTGTPPQTPPTI